MSALTFTYEVPGDDFTRAGEASSDVKRKLKQLGYNPEAIRKVAIAMYEGEINMVIHANGGEAKVEVDPHEIRITLSDKGPGIPDVEKAMQEGWSTAPDTILCARRSHAGTGTRDRKAACRQRAGRQIRICYQYAYRPRPYP